MESNNILKFYKVTILGEDAEIELHDLGNNRYKCYFCRPKDSKDFKTFGFEVIDENENTILPEKNGNLTKEAAENIWKQIKEKINFPDKIKKL